MSSKPSNPNSEPQSAPEQAHAATPNPASPSGGSSADDWVAIGEIIGTFGVRGDLKVRPLTDFPDRFERTPTIYLGDAHTPHAVESAHIHKQQVILHLADIADMNSAEQLRGALLWIHSADLLPLDTDSYYQHDLIGLRVLHVRGAELGTVSDIIPSGANDLLVVRNAQSGAETLLPAVKAFIKQVDLERGVIIVDPIPGLFDEDFEEAR